MGFAQEAERYRHAWFSIYNNPKSGSFPPVILKTAAKAIRLIVDAVCYAALAKLSPKHRAAVVLKDLEDFQYHEIAEGLNLSIGTVMSRLFYARKKLQSILRPGYIQICPTRQPTMWSAKPIGS